MTLSHRLTTAYAIIVTALLIGISHGNRSLLSLEETHPDHPLTEAERVRLIVHITVPYFGGGILAAVMFLGFSRPCRRKLKIG